MRVNTKIHWIFKGMLTLVYAWVIFAASSQDTSFVPIPPHVDKLIHCVEFGLLCFMTCWSLSSAKVGSKEIYKIILAMGVTSLYGMSDEFHQFFTPHRSVDVFDWLADTVGVVAAGFLWQALAHKLQAREKSLAVDKTPVDM